MHSFVSTLEHACPTEHQIQFSIRGVSGIFLQSARAFQQGGWNVVSKVL